MDRLKHLITDRVVELLNEANDLKPDSPIIFELMTDKQLLQRSAGAATSRDDLGNEVIYVDPSRATEHMVAHEIMHLILHRSGWPQMWCIIPTPIDIFARRLADGVDNCFDHLQFNSRLEALGFDVKGYRESYLSVLQGWPKTKIAGPDVLWNGLKILDALLWGPDFRNRILQITLSIQPESFELARQLCHRTIPAKTGTKSAVRSAMIEEMDFLEEWITRQSEIAPNLRQRIGISPLFTKEQLRQPASMAIGFKSEPFVINSEHHWLGGLVLKSDGTRIQNYTGVGATSEPPEFEKIRQNLQTLTLKDFIVAGEIRKYGTFP